MVKNSKILNSIESRCKTEGDYELPVFSATKVNTLANFSEKNPMDQFNKDLLR